MTRSPFAEAAARVRPVDDDGAGAAARDRLDGLAKPRGSLGRIEQLAARLAAMAGTCPPPLPDPAAICVFAGDHGVVGRGVTPWPQDVTRQMVATICRGGAAVNVLARQVGAAVTVIDVGVAGAPLSPAPRLLDRRIRAGTGDIAAGPAMSADQARAALDVGALVAARRVAAGARLLVAGDMGIGNTTPAAAVICAVTGRDAASVTGRGTGIDDATLARKTEIVRAAAGRLPSGATPEEIVAGVGGLEIAAMAGFFVGGAAARVPVLIDGVISASAALLACAQVPAAAGYLIAGHRSVEPGATAALDHLGLEPLLDLGMRLGEGSGATLAIPLVRAAAAILREMATLDDVTATPA